MNPPSARDLTLAWLAKWPTSGAPVSVLEGFSGVGKSFAVRGVLGSAEATSVFVSVPLGGSGGDDLLLELATELQAVGIPDMADSPDMNLRFGLEAAMRRKVLVVIDDFQYLLDPSSHLPPAGWLDLMRRIGDRPSNPGKLLLVTNESLPEGGWRDNVDVRRLIASVADDGVSILSSLLTASARSDAIALAQRPDVVRWLGGNPRAMQVLVGCLADDPLEDLIELERHAWEMKDDIISATLVRELETRFLDRTLHRLESSSLILVQYLACYRRPFSKDALERAAKATGAPEEAKKALTSRFLLEVHRNWYNLNPIARELALSQLRKSGEKTKAHSTAADHYTRHFTAKHVPGPLQHSKELVEARHHLLASSRGAEFAPIAARFRGILLTAYGRTITIPDRPEDVEELILLLAALLSEEDRGYAELRQFLARLLLARGRPGDDIVALGQTRLATRESPNPAVWTLHMALLARIEGVRPMRAAATQAYTRLSIGSRPLVFYAEAKMLGEAGMLPEAIEVVERGIASTPASSYSPLHQLGVGLLLRADRYPDAIELVVDSLGRISESDAPQAYGRVLEAGLYPALARQDTETIHRLQQLIPWGESTQGWRMLCDNLSLQASDKFEAASAISLDGYARYTGLRAAKVFSLLVVGQKKTAEEVHYSVQVSHQNPASEWLGGMLALSTKKGGIANSAFARCLGRPLTQEEKDDANLWIKIWDRIPAAVETYPAFFFPRLPKALTGLAADLVRHETSGSILKSDLVSQIVLAPTSGSQEDQPSAGGEFLGQPRLVIVNQVSPIFGAVNSGGGPVNGEVTYNVGQAGAVGPNAAASSMTFSLASEDSV